MKYITNIDTLSALLDRLISENIKLYFFRKENVIDNIEHQENLIEEIKYRITQLLLDTYNERQYEYISEKRTYKPEDIVETLEELIHNDITTGEGGMVLTNNKKCFEYNDAVKKFLDNSLMLVTALSPKVGYDNAAKIAKKALNNGTTLKHEAVRSGLISEKDYIKIVDPRKMVTPN